MKRIICAIALLLAISTAASAAVTIKSRRDTAANWTTNSTVVLAAGEIGVETDTLKIKIGDGTTAWSSLGYATVAPSTDQNFATTGTIKGRTLFNSYAADQTLTAATHNSTVVQMTVAGEVTMWDCETANVGDQVILWARDAEKIEVVPASGDHFALFNGTALTADYEMDVPATAGTKVTLMCTADDTWSVFHETAATTDGGAAD